MEQELPVGRIIQGLAVRQRTAERLTAALALWLILLSASTAGMSAAWLSGTTPAEAMKWISSTWATLSQLAAFLGLAGCVALAVALWRGCDMCLQAWLDRAVTKRLMNR